jgi:alpha-2-macroglobulin
MFKMFQGLLEIKKLLITGLVVFLVFTGITVAIILAQQIQTGPDLNVKVSDFKPSEYLSTLEPTNITVRFSRDMVPDDSLNILFADVPIEITPHIEGLGKWTDNNVFVFYPGAAFKPSTEYTIKIYSSKTYLYGNRINEPREFKLRTPTIAITNFWTEIAEVPDQEFSNRLIIHLTFSCQVDPIQLKEHIPVLLGDKLKLNLVEQAPATDMTITSEPFRTININGEFEFVITKGLNCVGGQIPLQGDYKQKFTIPKPEPFVIENVGSQGAGPNSRIEIRLSQSVALTEIQDYITITPKLDFTVSQYYSEIEILGNFKPRETYTIDIKKGLHSLNGQQLEQDFSGKVMIGDMPPRITFPDNGLFMSKKGGQLLAVETVNIDKITVEVEQIFPNNIVYYLGDYGRGYYGEDAGRLGRRIFSKDFTLNQTQNEPLTSTIDIGKIVGDTLRGVYNVAVRQKDQRWTYDLRQVMISDLGIMARLSGNYLIVWANSLGDTKPVSDAKVTLFSRNNQSILEGETDSHGVIIFENIAEKIKGYEPFVITVTKGSDLSYLQFSECLIPTSDFDVSGRPYLARGYESFLYSDRGVYRPGETVHLVSVVRGVESAVPQEFPYKIKIMDPEGRDFQEYKLTTRDGGISSLDIEIPSYAKTGGYALSAKIGDDLIGQYSFQVEEFMPDRIKTAIATDKDSYKAGDEVKIDVNGVYLFGPPCSGNPIDGHVTLESDLFQPKSYSEYSFSDPAVSFTPIQASLPSDNLDPQGNHTYHYKISQNLKPPSSLRMTVSATVREDGGRAVSAYKSVMVNPYPFYFGIKQGFEGYGQAGKPVNFTMVAINGDSQPTSVDSVWVKFYNITYQNIVKRDQNGIYRYQSDEKDVIIDSTLVSFTGSSVSVAFTPQDYGSFRARVGVKGGHSATVTFYVSGWGYSPWSMAHPDRIDLALDRKIYKAGDKAKLLVKAPFEGKLLLTFEKDKVLEYKTYNLDSNSAEIEIPIKKEYAPNIYVTATLIKSTTSLERYSPARAFGIAPIMVDNTKQMLSISIGAPDVMKPRQKLDLAIKTNLTKGTRVTVAAVDIGILQLTDFKTPDPFDFFYGKKRPGLNAYDIYSLVYPDIKEAESKLTPGGSAGYEASRKRHLNPINARRVKPVALWSGIVSVDAAGTAHVSFDIPQFNGKLLVMALGFDANKVGAASKEVTVRDKIIIQESLPRFIAGGDTIKTGMVIFNNTGTENDFDIGLDIAGPAKLVSAKNVRLHIPSNSKDLAEFTIKALDKPGKVVFNISAAGGGEHALETVELANRPGQPLQTKSGSGAIKSGTSANINMPTDWIEGTEEYQLKISPLPTVRLAGSIQYLLSYPYGCMEQTVSKLFPLLYFNDLAKFLQPEIFGGKGQDYYINEGIAKIATMQLPSGAFMFWKGDSQPNPWASVWATHFLVEARKLGYQINDDLYDKAIANMDQMSKETSQGATHGVLRIYSAYVLAKAGKLDKSIVNNLKLMNLEVIPVWSRFQLAGTIAMTSGTQDALWLMPAEIHPLKYEPQTGDNFDSDIRGNAILLDVLSDIAPDNPAIPELVNEISLKMFVNDWYTTQGNAFALLALGRYFHSQEKPDYTGTIIVDGKKYKQFGIDTLTINDPGIGGKNIEISINGAGNCYYWWQSSGVSSERTVREFDNRMVVRRQYLDSKGNPISLDSLHLGDQLVAKVTCEARDKELDNVAISDLLPSCLEIENPRLVTTGRLSWLPTNGYGPAYVDIRDDRLLMFVNNMNPGNRFVYYYSLRVVSRGNFFVPPVAAGCMYDPLIASASSSGMMKVEK